MSDKTSEASTLLAQREKIESLLKNHSESLASLPTLKNGLTPNEVKESEFYKFHKEQYDKHFRALREFNSKLSNVQKKELAMCKRAKKRVS